LKFSILHCAFSSDQRLEKFDRSWLVLALMLFIPMYQYSGTLLSLHNSYNVNSWVEISATTVGLLEETLYGGFFNSSFAWLTWYVATWYDSKF
jgi:hypothetical protein